MMKNFNNLIRVSNKAIEDESEYKILGFEITQCENEEELILRLPENWYIQEIESTKKENPKIIFDGKGRPRGSFSYYNFYLYTRYYIEGKRVYSSDSIETDRMYIFDRQENIVIEDYGRFEPYSDHHKDLYFSAMNFLEKKYPGWQKAYNYWD